MAKMATVALLSATVAFGHPGYANAGLFGGGEKVGKYAEDDTARYMREIEEARCVRWINLPSRDRNLLVNEPTPIEPPIDRSYARALTTPRPDSTPLPTSTARLRARPRHPS
jgi:hypothetical protein